MTNEEQQKDDIETMKILFNADINELCNQRRFNDAREMEGIRDRIIQALEQQPCEDCISRDDVDAYIAKLMSGYLYDEERTRLEEFSAYLWELPSVTPRTNLAETSQDCISRTELIQKLNTWDSKAHGIPNYAWKVIRELPSVTPQRPKGKWIEYEVDVAPHPLHCSLCGFSNHHISNRYMREFRRCPDCGAEMESEECNSTVAKSED